MLYVAMTRARERLYLTAQCLRGLDGKLNNADSEREFPSSYPILHATSYLNWILPAVSLTPAPDACYTVDIIAQSNVPAPQMYQAKQNTAESDLSDEDIDSFADTLRSRFSFVYPYEHLTKLPAKLSVSRLYPGMLDNEDDNAQSVEEPEKEQPRLGSMTFAPSFMDSEKCERTTGAERGTATHVFLQFCDFDNCVKNGVRAELDRLTERGFIPSRIASLVNFKQLTAFFESEFYASLSHAHEIRREQRFNIMLPAAVFSDKQDTSAALEGEKLLVQGVIDLFFTDEDGKLILCDYKTDYLSPEEIAEPSLAKAKLAERHRTQLSYYAAALERICGKRPDKVVIYSLPLGQALDVEIDII